MHVAKYKRYLMSPPGDATIDQEAQARQMQAWLQTDVGDALDTLSAPTSRQGHRHVHPDSDSLWYNREVIPHLGNLNACNLIITV